MKKVVIIGTAHPYRGGIAAFNDRLARALKDENYEVSVWTFSLQYPAFLFPGKTQYSEAPAPEGIDVVRAVNSIHPLNWFRVGRKLRKMAPDYVIFAYWMSFFAPCYGTIAREAKRNGKTRCFGLIHNMIPHEPSLIDKLFPPYFVKAMDGFVALSESVLGDIEQFDHANKPKRFAPHPLYDHYGPRESRETALQNLDLDPSQRYLLFFGLVRAYKGLDLLLEAFADVRLAAMPLKLLVVGEFYDEKQSYLDLMQRLQLENRVVLVDRYVPDDAVKDYFNAADIVVQPYKSATQSGVTQVAYHFEKAMLVTDVGGLKEIVPPEVGYVTPTEPSAIADALCDFFLNHRQADFEAGVAVEKQKYSWARMTETLSALFNS